MKNILKILNSFLIVGIISGCQSQPNSNLSNELEGCLETSEVELLNELTNKFEAHLKNSYNLNTVESYQRYLSDVSTMNLPLDFFKYLTFENDMKQFRESSFYKKSWVRTSTFDTTAIINLPPVEGQEEEVYDPIVLDPTGTYVKCLSKKTKSKAVSDIIETGLGDLNPQLVAGALLESLSSNELNDGLTRLFITINLHYQMGIYLAGLEDSDMMVSTSYTGTRQNIKDDNYYRYIITQRTSQPYLLRMIKEYGELPGTENSKVHSFWISNFGDWEIIRMGESVNFYAFHNLVSWFYGYEEDPDIPELSVGYAKSKIDSEQDYIFFLDPNSTAGDTEIGAFRKGTSFFIYLPEAYEQNGNLKVMKDFEVSFVENAQYLNQNGLDLTLID